MESSINLGIVPVSSETSDDRTPLVIVDAAVPNLSDIVEGLAPRSIVHVLESGCAPLVRITAVVRAAGPISRLDVIAHGRPGALSLAGLDVDAETVRDFVETEGSLLGDLADAPVAL